MGFGFWKFLNGVNIVPKSASIASSMGDLEVDSDTGRLLYHNGSIVDEVVTADSVDTLTNKTLEGPVIEDLQSLSFEETGAGTDTVTLSAPTSIPSSFTLFLPSDVGTSGYSLVTDGAGNLTWAAPGSGGNIGSAIGGATAGSILFVGAGGVLAQNNASFFWDNTNSIFRLTGTIAFNGASGQHLIWNTAASGNIGVTAATGGTDNRPRNMFLSNSLIVGNIAGFNPPYGLNHTLSPGSAYFGNIANAAIILGSNSFYNNGADSQSFMLFGKDPGGNIQTGFVNPATSLTNYEIYFSQVRRLASRIDYLRFGAGDLTFMQATDANLLWNTDGGGSVGASGANRPANVYASTSVQAPSFIGGTASLDALRLRDDDTNYAELVAPAAMAGNYTLTLPAALPASQKIVTFDNTGAIAADYVVDDATIEVVTNVIRVKDLGITTAKIDDEAVTLAKLAQVDFELSASCGNFSTASTSFTPVTNLSIEVTLTEDRPILLEVLADGNTTITNPSILQANGGNAAHYAIFRDSTNLGFTTIEDGTTCPASVVRMWDSPGIGTFTYTVQARGTAGSNANMLYSKLRSWKV